MKVCLLNDSFAPVIDGVVNVVMNYADHLIRDHGAEVIVGTPQYPGADYSAYPYKVVRSSMRCEQGSLYSKIYVPPVSQGKEAKVELNVIFSSRLRSRL